MRSGCCSRVLPGGSKGAPAHRSLSGWCWWEIGANCRGSQAFGRLLLQPFRAQILPLEAIAPTLQAAIHPYRRMPRSLRAVRADSSDGLLPGDDLLHLGQKPSASCHPLFRVSALWRRPMAFHPASVLNQGSLRLSWRHRTTNRLIVPAIVGLIAACGEFTAAQSMESGPDPIALLVTPDGLAVLGTIPAAHLATTGAFR